MPKREDISSVLVIGSGPIVIGQACEFDYSGTQACKALRKEGYRVVLVNSNPATIMTDPETADATYVEPITADVVERIIERERPDAFLPTLGGQTALNTAVELWEKGVLQGLGCEMIGARYEAIQKAEDREHFKAAIQSCGLQVPTSTIVRADLPERPKQLDAGALERYEMQKAKAMAVAVGEAQERIKAEIGLPCVIRPAYTLGGTGGGVAYNALELEQMLQRGIESSPINQVLVEQSVLGWKEFELELMRDGKDNAVVVCSIENFDPMGIHTGDSITVAPAQTLTDREYQLMRDAAIAVMREIGVDTGGSNIQFAIRPEDGEMVVIEMNPRVSRSSALASKATGFPIAKIAALLAVGYTLDEIPNDITKETCASFEPALDYCVTKVPRWAFEKFPEAEQTLTTQMKSVGETMAIGRTFKESLQKALRSLESGHAGLDALAGTEAMADDQLISALQRPSPARLFQVREALARGMGLDRVFEATKIDRWFLDNLEQICEEDRKLRRFKSLKEVPAQALAAAKRMGFGDVQLARMWKAGELDVRARRKQLGIEATFKLVDTCAAEFEAYTPYYYSTYGDEDETRDSGRKRIVILGSGPNRIGQGIEFDYCCVQASLGLREAGFETVMVNSNPETVSTDYDISDLLFFEPVTRENVLNICDRLRPEGVIVQLGGQTPLNIASELQEAGVHILGTSVESIARAEDRQQFEDMLEKLGLRRPPSGTAMDVEGAVAWASRLGYPVMMRPSYVLGGRAMFIVYTEAELREKMGMALEASPGHPVLIDKFLDEATEVEADCIADGREVVIGGVMEHIEQAGVHSGDSACALPPFSLPEQIVREIAEQTRAMALELGVRGLMNVQFAVKAGEVFVLEVNPRASRTIPFVSKAVGVSLAKLAARVMAGATLKEVGLTRQIVPRHFCVKECVLPFNKFPDCDIILGPEMRSTGEVMGIASEFGMAFAKSQMGAYQALPMGGTVAMSVRDSDKPPAVEIARSLNEMGFGILATAGTHAALAAAGVPSKPVNKIQEGRPNILDALMNGELGLIINTPTRTGSRTAEAQIRQYAVLHGIPVITTLAAARAAVLGIRASRENRLTVRTLQEYHADLAKETK